LRSFAVFSHTAAWFAQRVGAFFGRVFWQCSASLVVSLKHDGTDGTVNTDGTAIERAEGKDETANTGAN